MIAIIDYGMGNLASVKNAFLKLGYEAYSSSDPEEIMKAPKVVLPGVGAFEDAMKNLRQKGMDKLITEFVKNKTPLLGICLGLQLLFSESHENGIHQGLGIIEGKVSRLPAIYKVPHMGWNSISINPESTLLKGIDNYSYFYFVHSFYVDPDKKGLISATCDYGLEFAAAIEKDNLFATQFHPEKSSNIGLKILKNFGELES